ncbi:MAG: hydrogenobyrinic acid a,c-diamide synthase (glutamine-hydrolyzing) [Desulfobacterales bacterium]|nr:hydrogenobyrinic acid a,c-diamide synthase (glutamine-hydrolyzing) [Desulfobacterales bacterium]
MKMTVKPFPRIVISALRGGAGKTLLSIGLTAAWHNSGKKVASYKKGPDYIDAGWLAMAAGQPCYNLDTFLIKREAVLESFLFHSQNFDISVIEGNRGLYDGIDINGTTSTAEIAKLLQCPVVLSIDCTKSTRSMAAAVLGCMHFDPEVKIEGVILNRVANPRHESILRNSIEHYCGIPVVGAVPKLSHENFPERHMGLVPTPEHMWAQDAVWSAMEVSKKYLNIAQIEKIASNAVPLNIEYNKSINDITSGIGLKIGIIKDSAFQFYYPENIEVLSKSGAEIVYISPLTDMSIPQIDALYIGGGFPETHVEALADNNSFRNTILSLSKEGLPIYAECGGLMYLGESLVLNGKGYPMANVLPVVYEFCKTPQGHGYTIMMIEKPTPFFRKTGTLLYGHEFHYSRVLDFKGKNEDLAFLMKRGVGFHDHKDGIFYKNVLATYSHLHALGTPDWASGIIRVAFDFKNKKKKKNFECLTFFKGYRKNINKKFF